jgi:PAS domain S-box-containing protein
MQRSNMADDTRPVRALESDDVPERREGASISSMWRGTILDSIADGVFTVDDSWRITSFNRAAEQITGFGRQEVIGRPCYEVFRASICRTNCALRRTVDTGTPIVNVPVEAFKKDGRRLPLTVSTAILRAPDGRRVGGVETFRDMSAIEAIQRGASSHDELANIVGRHDTIQRIVDILPDIALSDATVLLQGPPGSGKALFARTIHDLSSRRDRPYVRVCCSALPGKLLELELFGGIDAAGRARPGRVRMADGGTLVLDEIGEIPPDLQLKLLQKKKGK